MIFPPSPHDLVIVSLLLLHCPLTNHRLLVTSSPHVIVDLIIKPCVSSFEFPNTGVAHGVSYTYIFPSLSRDKTMIPVYLLHMR